MGVSASGVILDSGGVLIRPISGQWFPPPAFEKVLAERRVAWASNLLEEALAVGDSYLDEVHPLPLADEVTERPVWVRYHEIMLEAVGVTVDVKELAEAITARWELELCVEPYPWTVPILSELQERQIPVVVLSDAWPSLRRWFREMGLDRYVQAMVISGEEGITKPDARVFAKALSLLGLDAADVVFVDDWPGHVRAATNLGMRGIRLREEHKDPDDMVEEITDLRDLIGYL